MDDRGGSAQIVRFGTFEADLESGELRKNGFKVPLQGQPFQVFAILLQHSGKIVSREGLRQQLWPDGTFVDFDHGLNTAITKIRTALDDSAENPRFVETVPRRGYRFIAPVDGAGPPAVRQNGQLSHLAEEQAAIPPAQPNGFPVIAAAKQHKWGVAGGVFAGLILLGGAGFGVYSILHRPAPRPFQEFTVTQVTNSGNAVTGAISPDGRYVASVMDDHGMRSLWLRNLPTGSDTQIVPPSASDYGRLLEFSPDGDYIYFLMGKNPNWDGYNLFRCPVLGGAPQKVVRNIISFAFSPDGQRIAYVRHNDPEAAKYEILTATAEGDNETVWQVGSTTKGPLGVAWSRKGDEIYYSLKPWEEGISAIDVLDLGTGKSHRFATFKDKVPQDIRWSPDGRALFALYGGQIGLVDSIRGDIEPITRDPNSYGNLTLSADGRTLATVFTKNSATVSLLSKAGRGFVDPALVLSQSTYDLISLAWSADGNLLVSNAFRLLKMGADGKNQTQLLTDPSAVIRFPDSCGTNYLVLNWGHHGVFNLWRTDADGSSPVKLTDGNLDWSATPVCSPDGKWVYYIDLISQHISRAPLDGSGKSEAIFDAPSNYFFSGGLTISPDSKTLAAPVEKPPGVVDLALFELGSSSPPRILDAHIYSWGVTDLQSTHDGSSVAYVRRQNGVDNLWVNPLDGSAAYPITDFKSETMGYFGFSPDGKRLAIVRGHGESDVVLLQETKP